VENGLIVGILTETNQFVQIDPPISADRIDNLETFHAIGYGNKGFFEADKAITTVRKKDEMRLSSIRNIGLEAQFYASFRTTARILLGEHDKREIRKKLIEDLDNHSLMFSVKLKNTMYTLQILLKGAIQFITFEDTVLNDLEDISTCISSYDSKKYCLIENTEYQPVLLLPKQNLLNPEIKNNDYYFRRLADELIRYKRIRLFLLEPKQFLNITNMEYKISPHEFILLQSLLDGNYFDDLIPFQINDYVENIPYDLAQPIIQQKYSNLVSLKEQETENTEISQSADTFIVQCVKETLDEVIGNQKSEWKRIFPSSAKEIILNHSSICTFYLIVYIYNKHTGRTISIETLKGILITKYSQIMPKHKDNILSILSKQGGKREMIKRVQTSRIQLDTLIKSEEYYLTNLDLWALADILKLPILLFSTKPLKNLLLENINWVILGGNRFNDSYFCIRSPVESKDTQGGIPNYQLIDPPMKLSSLREDFITRINNEEYVENNLSFESYLDYHHRHLDR
jgi:hypothetical protein